MALSDHVSNAKCPKCKKELGLKLSDIKPEKLITCKHCGAQIRLKGDDVAKQAKDFDDLFKKFR